MRQERLESEAWQKQLERQREKYKTPEYRKWHAEYMAQTRAARRAAGVCVTCGKEDAFAPFHNCPACIEKIGVYYAKYGKKTRRWKKQQRLNQRKKKK